MITYTNKRFNRRKEMAELDAKKFWIILKVAIRIRMRIKRKQGSKAKAQRMSKMGKGMPLNEAMMEVTRCTTIRHSLNSGIGVFVKDGIRQ